MVENETLLQKSWLQFSHLCFLSVLTRTQLNQGVLVAKWKSSLRKVDGRHNEILYLSGLLLLNCSYMSTIVSLCVFILCGNPSSIYGFLLKHFVCFPTLERTWLFLKCVVYTKFNIYVFIAITRSTPLFVDYLSPRISSI